MVTHSPQPSPFGVTTRTSSSSRTSCVPNDVRNGATNGICTRRSSTPLGFMTASPRDHVPSGTIESDDPGFLRHQASQHLPKRDAPRLAPARVRAPECLDVRRHTDQDDRHVGHCGPRAPVRCDGQGGSRTVLPQRGDVDAGGLTARGGGGRRAWQVPTDHQPVGVTGAVDAVAHRPVEVGEVARRTGAELGQVEMRVPPDQGIERPGDQRDVLAQRPGALVQFEGEPDAPAEASRRDPAM